MPQHAGHHIRLVCAHHYLSSVHERLGPVIVYSENLQERIRLAEKILWREENIY